MRQSTRIVVNALISYGRMVITVGLGLLTTRLVLANLGVTDFGLFALLSSVTGFMTTAAAASSASVQRHIAIEIGRDNLVAARRVFATALLIHIGFAIVVVIVGSLVKAYALNYLNIPAERVAAASGAFGIILVGAAIGMAVAPVSALFAAKQLLLRDAAFAVLNSAAAFFVAWMLPRFSGDRLSAFAHWQIGLQIALNVVQALSAALLFREARISWSDPERARAWPLLSIAGWSLLTTWAWAARMYGGTILLSAFFGPAVTAGYAIALQAGTYVSNFSYVLARVAQPVMSTLEGKGRPEAFSRLMYMTGKAMIAASALIALPLIVAPNEVLHVWLREVPASAVYFVPLLLSSILVLHSLVGHETAMLASGALEKVAGISFLILVSVVPAAVLAFHTMNAPAATYGWLLLATAILSIVYYVPAASRLLGYSSRNWVRSVAAPAFAMASGAGCVGLIVRKWVSSLPTLCVAVATIDGVLLMLAWWVLMNSTERSTILATVLPRRKTLAGRS